MRDYYIGATHEIKSLYTYRIKGRQGPTKILQPVSYVHILHFHTNCRSVRSFASRSFIRFPFTIMKFSAGVTSLVVIAGAASLAAALPVDFSSELFAREYDDDAELFARWGSGKYTLDDDTYHRVVKPQFLTAFKGDRSFASLCGTNPDFMIDKSGDVYPSAVGKFKSSGKCTKAKFTKNLGHLVVAAQPKRSPSPSPPPSPREYDEEADELFARWGSGKYTLDDDTYHRVVKPQFLSAFNGDRSFASLCGGNPDFMIDRSGDVYPSAVGKFKSSGKCTKAKFTKNLGHLVVAAQPKRSPSPSPPPSPREYDEEADELFARWGSGKYTLDDDTYHRVVKPQFLSAFNGDRSFASLCGGNPDFMIDRSGDVYPSAVGKFKSSGKCTKAKFTKNLGHLVVAAQPKRSPSPSPPPSPRKVR